MKSFSITLILLLPVFAQAQHLTPGGDSQPIPQAVTSTDQAPQIGSADLIHMSAESYTSLRLPPLYVLMQNARERSPHVNMFAANKEVEERELKTLRRSWQKIIKLNGTFSYGLTDTNSQIYYENQSPVVQNVTGTAQRWWNVGASVSLPLDEIFNRRNRNQQQRKRIESIDYEMNNWYDEICMKIIESYTNAVEGLAILGAAAQTMIIAQAQYETAEASFINGQIDAAVLSRQKGLESDAIRQYEQIRAVVNKSLLQLEILSKTPIISRPEQVDNTQK